MKQRQYFTFFRSYFEAIREIDDATIQRDILFAIIEYQLDGKEPDLKGISSMLWKAIFPNLRNSRTLFENGCKGGAKKGNKNAKRWKKPTIEEVKAYCDEKGYTMNAESFFDHNEMIGWAGARKYGSWEEVADIWEEKVVSGEFEY